MKNWLDTAPVSPNKKQGCGHAMVRDTMKSTQNGGGGEATIPSSLLPLKQPSDFRTNYWSGRRSDLELASWKRQRARGVAWQKEHLSGMRSSLLQNKVQ